MDDLPEEAAGLVVDGPALALLSIGGNDLMLGLLADHEPGLAAFADQLTTVLNTLPMRPALIGTAYDPTLGDSAAAAAAREGRAW